MSRRNNRLRSLVIALIAIVATNVAISHGFSAKNSLPALSEETKSKSGLPIIPDPPKPRSGIPIVPDVPRP